MCVCVCVRVRVRVSVLLNCEKVNTRSTYSIFGDQRALCNYSAAAE